MRIARPTADTDTRRGFILEDMHLDDIVWHIIRSRPCGRCEGTGYAYVGGNIGIDRCPACG